MKNARRCIAARFRRPSPALFPGLLAAALLAGSGLRAADSALPPMNGYPADFAPRRAGAEADARIKLSVTNEGLYRLTQPELVAAGVDPMELAGSQLRLFCTTQEVAIFVSNGGLWTADDYLVFYATAFDGGYSDANVYWLGLGEGGKRMAVRPAAPIPGLPDTVACPWRARYHRDTFIQDKYRAEDEGSDHWFAEVLSEADPVCLGLVTDEAEPDQPAVLTAVLYGHSNAGKINPDHFTRIKLNGAWLVDFPFDGTIAITGTAALAGSQLKGTNTVWFKQLLRKGLSVDRVLLEAFTIDYTRRLAALDGALIFPGRAGAANYRVRGLAEEAGLWLLDIADPGNPALLADYAVSAGDDGWTVRFGDAAARAGRYAVCQDSRLQAVSKTEIVFFQGLADPDRQADYLMIAPAAFIPQLNRLAAKRMLEGLTVEVAALSDIYNEFGYGITDAAAIKAYIGYAYHHRQGPPPRYVLLAGNGSYDPRGNLLALRGKKAFAARERIPVHMGPSPCGWASLDGWYVQVDGPNRLPDLALGRLPAESAGMLSNMVDKIFAFEAAPKKNWKRREALLVADRSDRSMAGKIVCEQLRTSCLSPAGYWCTTGYGDDLDETTLRQIISETFTAGVSLVYYFGHGDVSHWGADILDDRDLASFDNAYSPVVVMMACRNGAYQNPIGERSMAEAFLQRPAGGASACIGTTAISFGPSSVVFAKGFSRGVVTAKTRRIGDAFRTGLADLSVYNPWTQELLYMNLFADPAMTVNPP